MVKIKDNAITLTQGDSLTLTVTLTKDDIAFTPEEGDVVRFALAKKFKGEYGYSLLLEKTVPNDTLEFTLTAVETEKLPIGVYNYDLELTYADGNVDTFISSTFEIVGEVE